MKDTMFPYVSFLFSFLLSVAASAPVVDEETNISYETKYFDQKLDHFNFLNKDTFKNKYLISDKYWKRGEGPIFVYTGNEAEIELFYNNTGFMWDIAPEFGALLIFIEHRYYGESLPNLNKSSKDYYSYLSTVQVLEDFAVILEETRRTIEGGEHLPIIAFGGSYGGMLAAWMRIKYPHIIEGVLASSAPMLLYHYVNECNSFYKLTTQVFERESPECPKNIRRSWDIINTFNTTEDGYNYLTETFNLCERLNSTENITKLKDWLSDQYGAWAMANYPYPNSFLGELPAWPIKNFCTHLKKTSMEDHELMEALSNAISSVINSTGNMKCLDIMTGAFEGVGMQSWTYQTCTEILLPYCTNGENDMFESKTWDFAVELKECNDTYNVIPDLQFINVTYGGTDLRATSNIIFSNGDIDPWRGGGILESSTDSIVIIQIAEAAHHLDLRRSNPNDPPSLIKAREMEKSYIKQWIDEFKKRKV